MADDSELERRAVEELLKETDRARVRAETMGPAGWLKCPLRSTNKRFLLNTLRSTGMQQRTGEPAARRGRPSRSESPNRSRSRSRSRTPPRDHRNNGGHAHHKHHRSSRSHKDKKQDRDIERSHKHKDNRDRRHGKDGPSTDKDRR